MNKPVFQQYRDLDQLISYLPLSVLSIAIDDLQEIQQEVVAHSFRQIPSCSVSLLESLTNRRKRLSQQDLHELSSLVGKTFQLLSVSDSYQTTELLDTLAQTLEQRLCQETAA